MGSRTLHQCQCWECQEGKEPTRSYHEQLNLLMSRLNEQQGRWMAALEAKRLGHGGTQRLSSNSKFKTLRRVEGQRGIRIREHKVNQMLPTLKQQILRQAENVLKESFASAALLANLLVGRIHQLEHGVEQEG